MLVRRIKWFLFFSIFNIAVYAQTDTSLVLLKSIDSTIITDVKYATRNNFTKNVLYSSDKVYLRHAAAVQLAKVNQFLKKSFNLRIKVFDGYRPLSVQKFMWSILPDEKYVADPAKGSRHNRGCAVDLTLINSDGFELDMGTPFDDFTEKAHPGFTGISERAKTNRKILNLAMMQYGFVRMETEWWHFDYSGWEKYSILDTPVK
jgi:D-alanyl-D-alanine dipeptidase